MTGSEREAWPGGPPAITRTKDGSRPHSREADSSKHWHRRSTDGSGSERDAGLDVDTPTPPDRLSVIRDAIDRFTGRRRYQISEDDIDDLAVEIDGLLPATPDPSIPERPGPRTEAGQMLLAEVFGPLPLGLPRCLREEPLNTILAIENEAAALGSIPERPAESLLSRFIDTNEGPVLVTDGHHVRPATELELAFRAALQSTPESRPRPESDDTPEQAAAWDAIKEGRTPW